ncbi:uncharacterized protein [Diadema antillarum]|uniref:uncharacterized protein n=1 Tax=Diadema antillarum TaxID=105358 RepID=UPI003A835EC3
MIHRVMEQNSCQRMMTSSCFVFLLVVVVIVIVTPISNAEASKSDNHVLVFDDSDECRGICNDFADRYCDNFLRICEPCSKRNCLLRANDHSDCPSKCLEFFRRTSHEALGDRTHRRGHSTARPSSKSLRFAVMDDRGEILTTHMDSSPATVRQERDFNAILPLETRLRDVAPLKLPILVVIVMLGVGMATTLIISIMLALYSAIWKKITTSVAVPSTYAAAKDRSGANKIVSALVYCPEKDGQPKQIHAITRLV